MTMKWDPAPHQNPLARARGLGAAGSGVDHWISQRITALANIPLTLWLLWSAASLLPGATYETLTAFVAQPFHAVLLILTVLSVFYHAALGLQVVIEDYVHEEGRKIFKLMVVRGLLFLGATACLFAILKIAL